MMERIVIPARQGRGVHLKAGSLFRAVDVEGKQCGDIFAFSTDDVTEYASAEHTRLHTRRLFPAVGEQFYTNRRRPILTFEEDATPGKHDMLMAACDPIGYKLLGFEEHASCQENMKRVMMELGYNHVDVPQPINVFTNTPVNDDGTIGCEPALTKPGDYIVLRTELDCYVVLTACPQDVVPINDGTPTSLALELLE
jgi:uncharacterized protein